MTSKENTTIQILTDALRNLLDATSHYGYRDDSSEAFWDSYADQAGEDGLSSDDIRHRVWDAAKQVLIGVETAPRSEPYLVTLACVPARVRDNKFSKPETLAAWHAGAKVEPYGQPLEDGKEVAVRLDGTAASTSVAASELEDHIDWSRVPAKPSYTGLSSGSYDSGYAHASGYHN